MLDPFHSPYTRACLGRLSGTHVLLRKVHVIALTLNVSCNMVCHAEVERPRLEFNLPPSKLGPFVPRCVNPAHEIEVIDIFEGAEVRSLEKM